MTQSTYTRQELFILRNHVPIDSLIEELGIPSKVSEGYVRFCCPVCHEFNSAVNPKTNLARCFKCRKNYNTIDLVMFVNRSNFIQSVNFLQNLHARNESTVHPTHHSLKKTSPAELVPIADIFKMLGIERAPVSEKQQPNHVLSVKQLHERLLKLEQTVDRLVEKINNK